MKIYAFYKKPTKDIMDLPEKELTIKMKYPLYAFTSDKNIAAVFLLSRKKSAFLRKSYKVTKDEYEEFALPKRGCMLNWVMLENSKGKEPTFINLVATENEVDFVLETIEHHGVWNFIDGWVPIDIFRGKFRKCLETLQYDKIYRFVAASRYGSSMNHEDPIYEDGGFDIFDLNIEYSQFGVFIIVYGHLLSKDFMKYADVLPVDEVAGRYSV